MVPNVIAYPAKQTAGRNTAKIFEPLNVTEGGSDDEEEDEMQEMFDEKVGPIL